MGILISYFWRSMAKTNREKSIKREDTIARDFQGRRVAMSGGSWSNPGDASSMEFLFEDKFTAKSYYSLKLTLLEKIEKQASFKRRIPIFRFGFTEKSSYNYVVIKDFYIKEYSATEVFTVLLKTYRLTPIYLEEFFSKNIFLHLNYIDTNNNYVIMPYSYFKDNYKTILTME